MAVRVMRSREKTLLLKRASAVMVMLIMLLTLSACAQNPEPRQQKESTAPVAAALSAAEAQAAAANPAAGENQAADAQAAAEKPIASTNQETPAREEPKTVQAAAANPASAAPAALAPAAGSASLKDSHKASMSIQMDDGSFILANTLIDFETGDSVLSVLIKIGKENAIPVVFSGSKKNAYIEGINNIFEFDQGASSGWIYKVNGETPMRSCGAYEIQPKDEIEWIYVTKLAEAMK